MYPKTVRPVRLMLDMVVIGRDRFRPVQAPHASSKNDIIYQARDLSPVRLGEPARQTGVQEIRSTDVLP